MVHPWTAERKKTSEMRENKSPGRRAQIANKDILINVSLCEYGKSKKLRPRNRSGQTLVQVQRNRTKG